MTQPTTEADSKPRWLRRAAAAVALAALVAALIYLLWAALYRWPVVLIGVVPLGVAVVAAWYILSRRGVARAIAAVVGAFAVLVFAVIVIASESLRVLVTGLVLAACRLERRATPYA